MKFRIMEVLSDGAEMWNYDLVKMLMEEYGEKSGFQRDSINFDLIELQASGFIEPTESKIDIDGTFRQDALLNKYKITDLGMSQYEELCSKIKIKEA